MSSLRLTVADPEFSRRGRGSNFQGGGENLLLAKFLPKALAALRGAPGTRPPLGPNFFNFMQFLRKIGKNNRLVPPLLQLAHPPPLGNPVSATGKLHENERIWIGGTSLAQPPRSANEISCSHKVVQCPTFLVDYFSL